MANVENGATKPWQWVTKGEIAMWAGTGLFGSSAFLEQHLHGYTELASNLGGISGLLLLGVLGKMGFRYMRHS